MPLTPEQIAAYRNLANRGVQADDGYAYLVPAKDLVEMSEAIRTLTEQLDPATDATTTETETPA